MVLIKKKTYLQTDVWLGFISSGIGNLFSFDDDTTLKDMSIENEELNIIKLYLHDTYSISLDVEQILELTKNK